MTLDARSFRKPDEGHVGAKEFGTYLPPQLVKVLGLWTRRGIDGDNGRSGVAENDELMRDGITVFDGLVEKFLKSLDRLAQRQEFHFECVGRDDVGAQFLVGLALVNDPLDRGSPAFTRTTSTVRIPDRFAIAAQGAVNVDAVVGIDRDVLVDGQVGGRKGVDGGRVARNRCGCRSGQESEIRHLGGLIVSRHRGRADASLRAGRARGTCNASRGRCHGWRSKWGIVRGGRRRVRVVRVGSAVGVARLRVGRGRRRTGVGCVRIIWAVWLCRDGRVRGGTVVGRRGERREIAGRRGAVRGKRRAVITRRRVAAGIVRVAHDADCQCELLLELV